MNLLPPAAQAGEWDWELANYVGDALYDEICRESYDLIMLCGRAVATALGISTKYPFLTRLGMHDKSRCVDQDGRCRRERRWYALDDLERAVSGPEVLLLPHPSGLNRWWNDEVNILLAQDAVARSLCSARQRSKGQ